ncbi:hypothetical protein FJTKL_00134 [Diaporthe vaccinii]|uniref:Uncharacterized protein n=1 Tax=Diaporthe vaccinii TaxID=105482 RepID=A0ABR4E4D5_9PEZI
MYERAHQPVDPTSTSGDVMITSAACLWLVRHPKDRTRNGKPNEAVGFLILMRSASGAAVYRPLGRSGGRNWLLGSKRCDLSSQPPGVLLHLWCDGRMMATSGELLLIRVGVCFGWSWVPPRQSMKEQGDAEMMREVDGFGHSRVR